MAEQIALSACIENIENQIRRNRPADALAVCRHVLKFYPKHLETYSLMAQALVQQSDWDGALDIYRRVQSADPENIGAYVGIARLFDDRKQLEETIWYMERAYELAPTRADIRKELHRLYRQRDGASLDRIKLTRGALARLYVQEGLFTQAIREFREINAASPSRYDTRVALAETLWRSGQTRQAADEAQSLLETLPYCLKANLILGTAWQESEIQESENFLQLAQALDPSNHLALKLLGDRSPLRPVQVTIPKFPGAAPTPPLSEEAPNVSAARESAPSEENPAVPSIASSVQEVISSEPEQKLEPIENERALTEDRRAIAEDQSPPAEEGPLESDDSPVDGLPPWLSEQQIPAQPTQSEISTAAQSMDAPDVSLDWLTALRKSFSGKPDEGITGQSVNMPIIKTEEPKPGIQATSRTPPAKTAPIDSIREVHTTDSSPTASLPNDSIQETRAADSSTVASPPSLQMLADYLEHSAQVPPPSENPARKETNSIEPTTETHPAEPETVISEREEPQVPDWLRDTKDDNSEDQSMQVEPPAWFKESSPEAIDSAEPEKPHEVKLPKWVDEISQRYWGERKSADSETKSEEQIEPAHDESEEVKPESPAETPVGESKMTQAQPSLTESSAPEPVTPSATPEPEVTEGTEPSPPLQTLQPKYYSRLVQAREHRDASRLSDAFAEYDFVIQNEPRLVSEVIMDLEALVAGGDAPLDAHRVLADAYARAGRLNDAIERYRFVYDRAKKDNS